MFLLRDNIAANNFAFHSLGEKGIFVPTPSSFHYLEGMRFFYWHADKLNLKC